MSDMSDDEIEATRELYEKKRKEQRNGEQQKN